MKKEFLYDMMVLVHDGMYARDMLNEEKARDRIVKNLRFGMGSFGKSLSELIIVADKNNREKIAVAFSEIILKAELKRP